MNQKNLTFTLIVILSLSFCFPASQVETKLAETNNNLLPNAATKDWTFLVYMCGDNNLEPFAIDDINELEYGGGTNDDVNVVVMVDRSDIDYETPDYAADWDETRYYIIQPDTNMGTIVSPINTSLGEINMGDPQNLRNFVIWGLTNFPADATALIIWDHGDGLLGTCWDDHDEDFLTINEIQTALSGYHFDLIGFDACVMGHLEIVYELQDYCDVFVSSLYSEPGDGWPFESIIAELHSNPFMNPSQLAQIICTEYVDSYMYEDVDVTMSAYNTSIIGTIIPQINALVTEMNNSLDTQKEEIYDAHMASDTFLPEYITEFYEFLTNLQIYASSSIGTAAGNVKTVLDNALIASESSLATDPYGLWIFLPSLPYKYSFDGYIENTNQTIHGLENTFYGIDFTADSNWDEFQIEWRNELETMIPAVNYPTPGYYSAFLSDGDLVYVQADLPAPAEGYAYEAVLTMSSSADFDLIFWSEEYFMYTEPEIFGISYYGSYGDPEEVLLPISISTTIYFVIFSYDGSGTYTLTINLIEYSDDIYEENDNIYDAAPISTNDDYVLILNDDDYFEFELIEGQYLEVEVTFNTYSYDIDIEIFDEFFETIDYSDSSDNYEEIAFYAPYSGVYYLLIYLYSGDLGAEYTLSISTLDGPFIMHVYADPYYPDAGDVVNIICTVEGLYAIETVLLSYSIDGGSYTNVTMSLATDGNYTAVIPGTAENYAYVQVYAKDVTGSWDKEGPYRIDYYEPSTNGIIFPWFIIPTTLLAIVILTKKRKK